MALENKMTETPIFDELLKQQSQDFISRWFQHEFEQMLVEGMPW